MKVNYATRWLVVLIGGGHILMDICSNPVGVINNGWVVVTQWVWVHRVCDTAAAGGELCVGVWVVEWEGLWVKVFTPAGEG